MQIVDPTTHRVYFVIDSDLLAELERRSDLDAIREDIADMQAGCSLPIDQARTADRAIFMIQSDEVHVLTIRRASQGTLIAADI